MERRRPRRAARVRTVSMKDRTSWTNWAGNQSCAPTSIRRPTSEDELVALRDVEADRRAVTLDHQSLVRGEQGRGLILELADANVSHDDIIPTM